MTQPLKRINIVIEKEIINKYSRIEKIHPFEFETIIKIKLRYKNKKTFLIKGFIMCEVKIYFSGQDMNSKLFSSHREFLELPRDHRERSFLYLRLND